MEVGSSEPASQPANQPASQQLASQPAASQQKRRISYKLLDIKVYKRSKLL